jgi:hypothetical protein
MKNNFFKNKLNGSRRIACEKTRNAAGREIIRFLSVSTGRNATEMK